MSRLLLSTLVALAIATPAVAHHETAGKSHAVATVTITEAVKADGKPLAPGTYEVWILNDRPNPGAGAPSDAQRVVELYQNGKMVHDPHPDGTGVLEEKHFDIIRKR